MNRFRIVAPLSTVPGALVPPAGGFGHHSGIHKAPAGSANPPTEGNRPVEMKPDNLSC